MPRKSEPRERLNAELPTSIMRKLDAMASYFGLSRTSMLIMCITDRYMLLPNATQREIAKRGGLTVPRIMPDGEHKSVVDPAQVAELAAEDDDTIYTHPDYPGRNFTRAEVDAWPEPPAPPNLDDLPDEVRKMVEEIDFDED